MLEEGDVKIREYVKEQIYRSFHELLLASNYVASEFTKNTEKLSKFQKNQLIFQGSEANEQQLREYINQLRDDYDPENYARKLLGILHTHAKILNEDLYEDLINYIRNDKKRRPKS
jgi:hypothetical protein